MRIIAGSTNISVYYYIVQDASATSPGEPVTGLLFSDIETGGSASYARQGAARVDLTLITLASASATHADGGFILVDDTNMPGLYRCDYPDAAFVTGIDEVICQIVVASAKNAVASPIFVEVTDNQAQTADHTAAIAAIPTTPMRGTDGANTTVPDNTGIAAIQAVTDLIPDAGAMTSIALEASVTVIDTNVDAIKVQTDKLTFTIANQLDSNIQSINDQIVTGDGGTGTEWQGAP